jgi:2-methylisocitrate lyase-like PEP mutase family enzyme
MDAKTQQQYARTFHNLHRKGEPLILFNARDVATAKAIAKTSPVVATSSAAVASALGGASRISDDASENRQRHIAA